MLLVAADITVVVFQAALFRAARPERGNVAAALNYTQLTNFTDAAFSPALSPDGRMLTFIRGENPELWAVREMSTSSSCQMVSQCNSLTTGRGR